MIPFKGHRNQIEFIVRGSQQTAVLKYFFVVIIYIINVAQTKIYRSLDNF